MREKIDNKYFYWGITFLGVIAASIITIIIVITNAINVIPLSCFLLFIFLPLLI